MHCIVPVQLVAVTWRCCPTCAAHVGLCILHDVSASAVNSSTSPLVSNKINSSFVNMPPVHLVYDAKDDLHQPTGELCIVETI